MILQKHNKNNFQKVLKKEKLLVKIKRLLKKRLLKKETLLAKRKLLKKENKLLTKKKYNFIYIFVDKKFSVTIVIRQPLYYYFYYTFITHNCPQSGRFE